MIPEWVKQYKEPGKTIKKIGDGYYLYKATSYRVEGKKYPVAKQEYLGRITETGFVDARKYLRVSETYAKKLKELIPDIADELADIILLGIEGEWYYTKLSTEQINELKKRKLYQNEKLPMEK